MSSNGKRDMKIINWFQIPALDINRATKFYGEVFKAAFHRMEAMGEQHAFFALDTLESLRTGGEIIQSPRQTPSQDGTLIYLNAPDGVDAVLARVEKAGGKMLLAKTSIGENGWIAIILDTEGNRIGVHST